MVIAAIMKAKGLALQDALRVLQARVPAASPNPGFMAQLELWGEMGCQIDEDHPGYKQFLLAKVRQTTVLFECSILSEPLFASSACDGEQSFYCAAVVDCCLQ